MWDIADTVFTLLGTLVIVLSVELLRCLRSIERRVTRIERPEDRKNHQD